MTHYATDTEFKPSGMAAPLVFISLFVLFVYGALFIGLMGVSNTIIHHYRLHFFLQFGNFGAFLGLCCILALWAILVFALAGIPWCILRAKGRGKTGRLVGQVIIFLMFHVFTMPVILWPMIRNSSPRLRARRVARLRRKVLERRRLTQ
ncbi:MAG: hypothetical protein DU429_07880 [Candidatus Tokpelaia sp.]|nr:MAG: hypothetical protein DU430_08105 [Candidatus Tokpelaia sp.]KAA6205540.1 MAG: hypothetical protein DU429_07880 [Candidatus Tokpelaia sp.]